MLGVATPVRDLCAQRTVVVQLLPPVFTNAAHAAAHMKADLPPKLLMALGQRNSGVSPCLITAQQLDSLSIPASSRDVHAIATAGEWLLSARCSRTGLVPYTVAIELTVNEPGPKVLARFVAFAPNRGVALDDTLTVLHYEEDYLANEIADRLILRLTRDIRIAISDFTMTVGDTARFQRMGIALPRMLATRLGSSRSNRLLLLEVSPQFRDSAGRESPGSHDQRTAVRLGRELHANYVIHGDFLVLGETLRIDVRCVSMESRAVIASLGASIPSITVKSIDSALVMLAAELRSAVEEDYMERANRPRYVGVAGVQPVPATRENEAMTREIVRTLERKLAYVTGTRLRVREQFTDVALRSGTEPRWNLASELSADLVIRVRLDRTLRDRPHIEAEYFDVESMQSSHPLSQRVAIDSVTVALDSIVSTLYQLYASPLTDSVRGRVGSLRSVEPERRPWTDFGIGLAVNHHAHDLFIGAGSGAILRFSKTTVIHGWDQQVWVEWLGFRLDLFGMKDWGRMMVVGYDVFVSAAWRLDRHRASSFFVGPLAGLLGVARRTPLDVQLDGALGVGLQAGLEHTLPTGRRIRYRLEYTTSFTDVPPKTLGGEFFPGGRAGGLYFTVATSRGS